MGVLSDSTVARYARAIKNSPRELIFNRRLLVSAALYATAGIPISESPNHLIGVSNEHRKAGLGAF